MAIDVKVTYKNSKLKPTLYRGEQFVVKDGLGFLFTEYHEVVPGGLVDLAQGSIISIGDDVKDVQVVKV